MTSIVEYYTSVLNASAYNKGMQSFLSNEETQQFFEDVKEQLEADSDYLINLFQVFTESTQVYTLGELMEASELQMQNGLNLSNVQKIWTNSETGLAKIATLLNPPEVAVAPNGKLRLIGGNHRIAALVLMLLEADADEDTILNTRIQVRQYEVNLDKVKQNMSVLDEETDEWIEPVHQDVINEANVLIHKLWIASNQSRTIGSAEIRGSKLYEKGINRNNPDEIIEAAFPERGNARLLSVSDALKYLSAYYFNENDELAEAVDDDGENLANVDEMKRFVDLNFSEDYTILTQRNFEAIITSFVTALNKVVYEEEYTNKAGDHKVRKIKKWGKDLKDSSVVRNIAEALVSGANPLIVQAINEYQDTISDSEYYGNIGRSTAKIGAKLAEMFDAQFSPEYDVLAPKEEKPAANKSRRRARKHLSLSL